MGARNFVPVKVMPQLGLQLVAANVTRVGQEQENLCWAACTVMIVTLLKNAAPSQCQLAKQLYNIQTPPPTKPVPDCCLFPALSACNTGCDEAQVEVIYKLQNVPATRTAVVNPGNATIIGNIVAAIHNEISAASPRPVEASYDTGINSAHAIVIKGVFVNGSEVKGFLLVDPQNPDACVPADSLVSPHTSWTLTNIWTFLR